MGPTRLDGSVKRVLVTGGGGFIGSRLVQALLERGLEVKVLDVQPGLLRDTRDPHLQIVGVGGDTLKGGMADREAARLAVQGVDVVYHLAFNWNGHTWMHTLPIADLFDSNVRGTLNLLEEASAQGVKHFLFSSSVAVYGHQTMPVIDEETVCRPETFDGDPGPAYGVVKLATERLCLLYWQWNKLPVTAFRIDVVFSDDEELLVSKDMVSSVRSGRAEVVEGEGSAGVHVDDVVDAFVSATLNRNTYGQVFNLSNPATYLSDQELYTFITQTLGAKTKVSTHRGMKKQACIFSIGKAKKVFAWNPQNGKEERKKAIAKVVLSTDEESSLKEKGFRSE